MWSRKQTSSSTVTNYFLLICSSIIWSSYHKGTLASSDYEGTVTLWDAFTGVKSKIFQVRKLNLQLLETTAEFVVVLCSLYFLLSLLGTREKVLEC